MRAFIYPRSPWQDVAEMARGRVVYIMVFDAIFGKPSPMPTYQVRYV